MAKRQLPADPAEWTLSERRDQLILDLEYEFEQSEIKQELDSGVAILMMQRAHDLLCALKVEEGQCSLCGDAMRGMLPVHHHHENGVTGVNVLAHGN